MAENPKTSPTGEGFGERIRLVRKSLGMTQKEFAAPLGINLYYLLYGDGEMLRENEDDVRWLCRLFRSRPDIEEFFKYFKKSSIVQYHTLGAFKRLPVKDREMIELEVSHWHAEKDDWKDKSD
ncbi:MAG: helix-turn-helix transcriptional regulator [bacterium]|nr:helix-turn-helix transcriptional regulator [bacterium]